MGIPVVVVLGIVFWILISLLKYWYVGRTKINYTHKLDDSVLEEIRKVPKGAFERVCHQFTAMLRERKDELIEIINLATYDCADYETEARKK